MKKIFILSCFIACFISCNQSSLEIDFSNINDPCEFIDAVEIFADDMISHEKEWDDMNAPFENDGPGIFFDYDEYEEEGMI